MGHVQAAPARPKPWRDRLTAGLFVSGLVVPPACGLWGGPSVSPAEFRAPAKWPAKPKDRNELAVYAPKVEAWAADRVGGRVALLDAHAAWKRDVLGLSPARRVALGRDGWLFLAPTDVNPFFRPAARRPGVEKHLAAWRDALNDRREFLAAQNVPYVVFVAPDKHSVYPEMLPPELAYLADDPLLDRLNAITAGDGLTIVDPRAELLAAKARDQVYLRQDTHWNMRGAWAAYQPLRKALARACPNFSGGELPGPEFVPPSAPGDRYVCDLARQIGIDVPDREEEYPQVRLNGPRPKAQGLPYAETSPYMDDHPVYYEAGGDPARPKLLYCCDSFVEAMRPFLGLDCREQLLLPCHDLGADSVYHARPDAVVQQMVENTLTQVPKRLPGVKDYRLRPLLVGVPVLTERVILEGESGPFILPVARVKDDKPEFAWSEPTPKYKVGQATFLRVTLGRPVGGAAEIEFTTNEPARIRATIRQRFTGAECVASLAHVVPGEPVKLRLVLDAEPGSIRSAWQAIDRNAGR